MEVQKVSMHASPCISTPKSRAVPSTTVQIMALPSMSMHASPCISMHLLPYTRMHAPRCVSSLRRASLTFCACPPRRRDAELHYLAGAVQTNGEQKNQDEIEQARQAMLSGNQEKADDERRIRAELRSRSREQKDLFHENAKELHLMRSAKTVSPFHTIPW